MQRGAASLGNEPRLQFPTRHLLAVRSILQAYGIADPTDFATQLHKAS
jgi:hypothetical protein